MIAFDHVTYTYEGREQPSLRDCSFTVEPGELILLTGESGCGKTTMIKLINGLLQHNGGGTLKGMVTVNGREVSQVPLWELAQTVGSVFQNPKSQFFNVDTTSEVLFGLESRGASHQEMEQALSSAARVCGVRPLLERNIFALSGGEKQRVLIARALVQDTPCLILDEPTNHLDIDSREWIEEAVEAYDGTLLFVSHDRYFINRFATRIWELTDGTITDYPCGFAQYRQMKAQEEAEKAAAPKPEKEREKPAAERPQRGNKAQQAARRQLTICERDIARAEERIAALEADMEAAACDYEKLNELVGQKDAAQAELDALYERWEQLSEEAEG